MSNPSLPIEWVLAVLLLSQVLLAGGVMWLAVMYYALRERFNSQAGHLANIEDVVREGRRQGNRLSHQCHELGIRVSQAALRAGRAESIAQAAGSGYYSSARPSTFDSYADIRYAAAVERSSAALVPSEARARRLEPLRFAPRSSSPSLSLVSFRPL